MYCAVRKKRLWKNNSDKASERACTLLFQREISGSCSTFGLKAGETAIEEYVTLIGSIFQNPKTQHFNVDTTAELAFPCENAGMPSDEIRRRVEVCSRECGIEKLLDRSIFKLSGGEKQRIAFAAVNER